MILIERLLFYPAALAATVFALKLAYDQPGAAAYTAVGALALFWALVAFKMMFKIVRWIFWLTVVAAAALTLWFKAGA
jgi:hypothetical protein